MSTFISLTMLDVQRVLLLFPKMAISLFSLATMDKLTCGTHSALSLPGGKMLRQLLTVFSQRPVLYRVLPSTPAR